MFKECSCCHHRWQNREELLADPHLEIIGYQACFEGVEEGLFLFNHRCKTTLALRVLDFDDLYQGVRYDAGLADSDECSGLCLDITRLDVCSAQCKYAYVRDIIQLIRKWPKKTEAENGAKS